jgi:hypothetical protein
VVLRSAAEVAKAIAWRTSENVTDRGWVSCGSVRFIEWLSYISRYPCGQDARRGGRCATRLNTDLCSGVAGRSTHEGLAWLAAHMTTMQRITQITCSTHPSNLRPQSACPGLMHGGGIQRLAHIRLVRPCHRGQGRLQRRRDGLRSGCCTASAAASSLLTAVQVTAACEAPTLKRGIACRTPRALCQASFTPHIA